jgi:hypothetical protein
VIAIQRLPVPALSLGLCFVALNTSLSAQEARTPRSSPMPPKETSVASTQGRSLTPQGFSVVLVLGDLQASSPSDDVPQAARKALTDMRDFLPYKSYRLLDAAWLLCCGHESRREGRPSVPMPAQTISQILRGPEGQEYELRLATSRADNGRVFVKFVLENTTEVALTTDGSESATARAMRTEQERRAIVQNLVQQTRAKFEVGTASQSDVARAELELKDVDRRIDDLRMRMERGARGGQTRSTTHDSARRKTIDTSFTMDVGETIVVGASGLRGGTKALIALLTAVAPRGAPAAVRD